MKWNWNASNDGTDTEIIKFQVAELVNTKDVKHTGVWMIHDIFNIGNGNRFVHNTEDVYKTKTLNKKY